MRVRFWGTRGSIATPGPSTVRYGGNTSCVELRTQRGTLLVFDAGTGLRVLGDALMKEPEAARRGHLLIGHTHWDHIQGFPFFAPFFIPGAEWDVYAPRGLDGSLREALAGQMQYQYFPVALDRLGATIRYHELVEGSFAIDDAAVTAQLLNHPALTLGYRVAADDAVVVYATDHECHSRECATPGPWEEDAVCRRDTREARHVAFLAAADLVIHDTQYTAAEYPQRIGWGHSTLEYAVDLALAAGAGALALHHHDPRRDDGAVDALVALGRERVRSSGKELHLFAAAEGLDVEVSPRPSESERREVVREDATVGLDTRAARVHPALVLCGPGPLERTLVAALTAEGLRLSSTEDPIEGRVIAESGPLAVALVEKAFLDLELPFAPSAPPLLRVAADGSGPVPTPHADAAADWLSAPFSVEYARTRLRAALLRTRARWATAPLPPDETRRLEVIRKLEAGLGDRGGFDRIVRIARRAFAAPMALVTVIDGETQWYIAGAGAPVEGSHRDRAFCAHAILGRDALVIPDAFLDERFADNPSVVGPPHVRFYAGHPFRAPTGEAIGTLCVFDPRPRELSAEDLETLRDLAALVELEVRGRLS